MCCCATAIISRMRFHHTGRGNPLADGQGYSYINSQRLLKAKQKEEEKGLPEIEPKKKTGTAADLRKLSMQVRGSSTS